MAYLGLLYVIVICAFVASAFAQKIAFIYNLRENQESGTFVGNVARDSLLYGNISESEFQRLKFTFFTQGNPNSKLFNIDEKSSTIRTEKVIDREEICNFQNECVVTLDIAVYMRDAVLNDFDLYRLMKVKVVINDVNDNAPTFPKSRVTLSVPESVQTGHVLLTSGAIDSDMGEQNSIQSYDLIPSNGMFGLKVVKNWDGSSDLGIVVKHPLDRETRDQFQVKVIAKDGGYPMKSGSVIIDVIVTDVNDNRPVFVNNRYNVAIYENIPFNKTVLMLSAVDTDAGINSMISYRFSSRVSDNVREAFSIESKSGRLYTIGDIDYEDTKQYQFMVEAFDGGSPSLSSQTLVSINIKDENDNYPKININLTPEGTDISEAVDTNKFVAHVSVSDKDSGRNSIVECTMSDSHFILESFIDDSYKIILGKKLDHETQAEHNVTITCKDNGQVPLQNSSSFTVHVLDENDNFPEFSETLYVGSIIENNDIGEEIIRVSAHDWDSGDNGRVRYSIDSGTGRYFTIDKYSGIISAKTALDRETKPEFKFNVMAKDYGNQPKAQSVGVVVTVLDQNDQPPKFKNQIFYCYVLENLNPGAPAGNISANDKDTTANSEMLFSIPINSWALDYFSVHPRTGVVSTKRKFDREVQEQYHFRVDVRDPQVPGFADSANVTVYILDDNDNVPIIVYPTAYNYTAEVPFDTEVGTVLATIEAFDDDEPANARIMYMLKSGNNRHLFNMNPATGDIGLSRRIRPEDSGLYKLVIMVSDSGNPPMTTRAKLWLNVAETNGTVHSSDDHGTELDKNMLIVISLVAVTLFLGIAVIATMCLIKRIDRERQQQVILMKAEEEKMFSVIKNPDSYSSGSRDSNENVDILNKKNIRKEVSFSLEDGADLNTTISSNVTSFSTFKTNHHSNKDPQDKCLVYGNNTVNSKSSIPASDKLPECMNTWNPREQEAYQLMEILKKADEDGSQSSGETGTSDSGRGGSDEEHHREDESKLYHANSFYPNNFNRFNDGRQSSLSLTSGHGSLNRSTTPIASYHTNPSGSVNSYHGTTGSLGNSFRRWQDIKNHGSDDVFEDSYLRSPKYILDQKPAFTSERKYMNYTPHPQHHLDESFKTGASSIYDDDDMTTTSGSYVMNPDELRYDLEGQFFNDVVV